MTEMKIKAIAPWFGGKRTLAPIIAKELGNHSAYFEPFCGSMAVLFAKEPSQKETVCDLHVDLTNLARVIADEHLAERLYHRLGSTLFSEDFLQQAGRELESSPLIDSSAEETSQGLAEHRAYWYFLASWMGRNGTAGTAREEYQIAVRWTKGGGSPTIRWRNAVESLPWWHQRLANVVILTRDAFCILDRFEDVETTALYIDSPYLLDTRSGTEKSSRYKHDFDELVQDPRDSEKMIDKHELLALMLQKYTRARIVVSYYEHPRLHELYAGWTFIDHLTIKRLHTQNGRGERVQAAPEVLIINGPSYAAKQAAEATLF